jgi:hypothetical protein
MKTRIAAAMAALAVLAMTPAAAAAAAPEKGAERHCAARVVGQEPSGRLVLDDLGCYSTPSARNAAAQDQLSAGRAGGAVVAMSSILLAVHYDYSNYSGSSFAMYGADCNDGYVDLTGNWWNNRISSTLGGDCARVRHMENADGSGGYADTFPTGALGTMSNKASRVSYHAS